MSVIRGKSIQLGEKGVTPSSLSIVLEGELLKFKNDKEQEVFKLDTTSDHTLSVELVEKVKQDSKEYTDNAVSSLAPKASPTFTGTPKTTPTNPSAYTEVSQIANIQTLLSFTRYHKTVNVTAHTDGVFTLTEAQSKDPFISFTGTPGQDIVVEFWKWAPGSTYTIRNTTSVKLTIRVQGQSSGGAVVPAGKTSNVVTQGTIMIGVVDPTVRDEMASQNAAIRTDFSAADAAVLSEAKTYSEFTYKGDYSPLTPYDVKDIVAHSDFYYYLKTLASTVTTRTNHVFNPKFSNNRDRWSAAGGTSLSVTGDVAKITVTSSGLTNTLILTTSSSDDIPAVKGDSLSASVSVKNTSSTSIVIQASIFLATIGSQRGSPVTLAPGESARLSVSVQVIWAGASTARFEVRCPVNTDIPAGSTLEISQPILEKTLEGGDYFDGGMSDTSTITYAWTGTENASPSTQIVETQSGLVGEPGTDQSWSELIPAQSESADTHNFKPVMVDWEPTSENLPASGYVAYMSRDRLTGWNAFTSELRETQDEGATWKVIKNFAGYNIEAVVELGNGELLVSTTQGSGLRKLWVSEGYVKGSGNTVNFIERHQAHKELNKFVTGWCFNVHKNIVLVNEYGPKAGIEYGGVITAPGDNARYTYMSLDHGITWQIVFDLNEWLNDMEGVHLHGVAWDPWWDRIWVTFGDNAYGLGGTVFSDDLGATWHWANEGKNDEATDPLGVRHQVVGIKPMPDCILFGTDGTPNGIHRITRDQGKHTGKYQMDVAHRIDNETSTTHLCQSIWHFADNENAPVFFGFSSELNAAPSVIVATYDGFNFKTVWQDSEITSAGRGIRTVVGPTLRGNLIVGSFDNRNESGWTIWKGKCPTY